jgi:hypothetical protein
MHLKKPNYEAKQRKKMGIVLLIYLDQETWKARTLQGKDVEEVNVRDIYYIHFPSLASKLFHLLHMRINFWTSYLASKTFVDMLLLQQKYGFLLLLQTPNIYIYIYIYIYISNWKWETTFLSHTCHEPSFIYHKKKPYSHCNVYSLLKKKTSFKFVSTPSASWQCPS